ncbi:MAG TPA: ESPR-type extended signal peptide-containing protein, partial [Paenalcaligenes sp.]|nr:ESPR-type extended signal peptide-containing protein [Paenalcaligenes sp.]
MNHIYKSIWSERLGTYVTVAETTKSRGKRSGSSKAAVVGVLLTLSSVSGIAAAAAVVVGPGSSTGGGANVCSSVDDQSWTCQIPNDEGGFATISGIPTDPVTLGPDLTQLHDVIAANLGKDAILQGGVTTIASGDQAIAIGHGAQAAGNQSIALGFDAVASGLGSVAIGEQAGADAGSSSQGNTAVGF